MTPFSEKSKESKAPTGLPTTPGPVVSGTEDRVLWERSLPAQVFLNYFLALERQLALSPEAYDVTGLAAMGWQAATTPLDGDALENVRRQCLMAWQTEYALTQAANQAADGQYLRTALCWTFPQAYHASLFMIRGAMAALGIANRHETALEREVGRMVVRGVYPGALGFYAAGPYDEYRIHRLPGAGLRPSLTRPVTLADAQAQIGQFLRTTRNQRAVAVRRRTQADPEQALRTRQGKILEKFSARHWRELTWQMGYTTFFDLLGRLKLGGPGREIERYLEADIDFGAFQQALCRLIGYVLGLHEVLVAARVGEATYRAWIDALPQPLRRGPIELRLETLVAPALAQPILPLMTPQPGVWLK